MLSTIRTALLAALVLLPSLALAEAVSKEQEDKLRAALEAPEMGLKVQSVEASEIPGLFSVQFVSGPQVYATAAGDYFIAGDMFQVKGGEFINLGEQRRDAERKATLDAIPTEKMIVFSPEGETRAYVNVFTDVTCFYCQKLHKEVPALNAQGIEVRYLAYPRAGLGTDGFNKLATAWCADNPQDTLTRLKAKEAIPDKVCKDNPIAEEYALGQQLGVRGTPAIITQDGRMIPGYQSAEQLLVTLGLTAQPAK